MILGDTCTRNCSFCAVEKSKNGFLEADLGEPYRVAAMVRELNLKFAVITSVTRDDLDDGGAHIFAKTVESIRGLGREIKIELLIPDFKGNRSSLNMIAASLPDAAGHNIETVKRLYKDLRPQADYEVSLEVLRSIKEADNRITTKSSIMLGLGEKEAEVLCAMRDLRKNCCDILTLGQYLAPSKGHYPVKEFIDPEKFRKYKEIALSLGFRGVLSGPKVRSSYMAQELYGEAQQCMI